MKKNLLGLLVMLFAFVSCEGDQGPAGPPGKDGVGSNFHTEFFTIKEDDWLIQDDGGGPYFYCERKISNLTEDIYEYKIVAAYMFLYNTDFEEQTPLPYPVPFEDGPNDRWQEYYSYAFTPGYITFFIRYNDFNMSLPPKGQEYKVVLNW